MNAWDLELRSRPTTLDHAALKRSATDSADAIAAHLMEFAARPSVERADQVVALLYGAGQCVLRFRELLVQEGEPR